MMGAESTRNMYSNLAEKNKYDCLKLHHVGYLIKYHREVAGNRYLPNVGVHLPTYTASHPRRSILTFTKFYSQHSP
jgi:hypothetical protein